eukprot:GHVP01068003.1.p1 GENE.GHVP01068003.1~~GHVP01068003.1.p1  ORF type:complete len:317 (+),score=28.53 GHVP01068003.1:751-1701(+)
MGNGKETFAKIVRALGFAASICIFLIGIFNILNSQAKLTWPSSFFDDDVNKSQWRYRLFTFVPDIFFDIWTPVVFGFFGIVAHFKSITKFHLFTKPINSSFLGFFGFHLISFLFAGIGYAGGFGIIMAPLSALVALLSLILVFIHNTEASLQLNFPLSEKIPIGEKGSKLKELATITRWTGFIACICALVVGFFQIVTIKASLEWPTNGFFMDVNYVLWRNKLFSFAPIVFVDSWTPIALGLLGALPHLKIALNLTHRIVQDFVSYFIFNLILAFWGVMGYAGGFGIILSIAPLLAALLSLILVFAANQPVIQSEA